MGSFARFFWVFQLDEIHDATAKVSDYTAKDDMVYAVADAVTGA